MPGVDTGRQKVSAYLKEHKISYPMLAVSYGMNKQDVSDSTWGRDSRPPFFLRYPHALATHLSCFCIQEFQRHPC